MLPLFPLKIVVFPGERLPLHVFEKRYIQLINDCKHNNSVFGIPTYINGKLEYGTEMQLSKIEKEHSNGKLDVVCLGTRVFKITNFSKQFPGKLYSGGEVKYIDNDFDSDEVLQKEVLKKINVLYRELAVDNPPKIEVPFLSHQVLHKLGLSLDQEYLLLQMLFEKDRLTYLLDHLKITLPIIREMNRTKYKIKMNGHFKNFDPLDYDDFRM